MQALDCHGLDRVLEAPIRLPKALNGSEKVPKAHVADFARREPRRRPETIEGAELPPSALSPVGVSSLASEGFPTGSSGGP